jgi:DNA invertase Pin-like site-specific DNA recombinase
MRIGYARVSTVEQNLKLQLSALKEADCERIFEDLGVSGKANDRKGLAAAMDALQEGDTLVVWRLDRLGRSLGHLIEIINQIAAKGAHFQSLNEAIDTNSSGGRLVFHMMGALAEFERTLISERTRAGMKVAKDAGKTLGRPHSLSPEQVKASRKALADGEATIEELAKRHGVHARTLARALQRK